ncbi:TetR/AcrR family transcriptional regulator [Streptomyces sp. BI20]|uniref:TetR/AcrR family transcriptional regulator n=1 Tax=Streptomyces sp. BI20 TaxID=3403460 RepID=UPI003C76CB28
MTTRSSRITPEQTPTNPSRRRDARHNRSRLLTAAREIFAERGIDAPMAAVARRAGVGPATLYRHFPTRTDLLREAFAEQMTACRAALAAAVTDPDPWRGFSGLFEELCRLQRAERGFPAAFLTAFPVDARAHTREREAAERVLADLVRRARATGRLRPDFHPSDLVAALLAHGGLVTALPDDERASRRLTAHLLDGFRTHPDRRPLPPPGTLTLTSLATGPPDTRAHAQRPQPAAPPPSQVPTA